ncbi:MAG: rod shape-determining protein MreC [Flavobacteriaceae bacterium]|nr:MAG: rod shape-determining protein MreC [Flavobacteriaceae bacterium]
MQQIIYFIRKYKYFLFFLLLESVALFFILNNHRFHKSKFISSANFISGNLYEKTTQFSGYFNLKKANKILIEENTLLKNKLEKLKNVLDTSLVIKVNNSLYHQKYTYTAAKIINNKFNSDFNFLTLNKGKKDGVTTEMAVVNNKGIIGITDQTSYRYARAQSILNKTIGINARLKNSPYFGSLTWNGKDIRIVQLNDIPRQAVFKVGDTIITGGMSSIFPKGILIGTIQKITPGNSIKNTIDVALFNDLRHIENVYIISNFDKREIRTIEDTANE